MLLAIDIGNTNIVIGIIDNDQVAFTGRLATDKLKTADEYALQFVGMLNMKHIDVADIEGVIISSVVPPLIYLSLFSFNIFRIVSFFLFAFIISLLFVVFLINKVQSV